MKKLILILTIVFTTLLMGSNLDDARKAEERGDYKEAITLYSKACNEDNNGKACLLVGSIFMNGNMTETNLLIALIYFKKACDNNENMGCEFYSILEKFLRK